MERQIEVAGAEGPTKPRPVRDAGPERRYTPFVAAAIGLLVGSMATLTLSQSPVLEMESPNSTQVISEPDATGPSRTTLPPVGQPTLAEMIPGLPSDLVAFGMDSGGLPVVQQWDLNATSPVSTNVRLQSGMIDRSGTFLASMEDQRYGDGFNLLVGTPNLVETIATDAGSFAWNTTTAREIAWTERTSTGFVLRSRQVPRNDTELPAFEIEVPDDVFIAWFREDTVTIQDNQGLLTTFDRTGLVVAESIAFSDGPSGLAVTTDIAGVAMIDDALFVMSTDLELITEIPVEEGSQCFPWQFAPTQDSVARRLAMLCFARNEAAIMVVDIEVKSDGAVSVSTPASFSIDLPGSPMWLGDDRFIGVTRPAAASLPRTELQVFDLDTRDQYTLSWPGSVTQVIAFGQR